MISTLFTIGFTKKTAEEFFRLLREAQVQMLIDVRENRVGQLAGFAKYPDLAFFLERLGGVAYDYQPMFAPSPEIRNAYRQSHDWEQYQSSFRELMAQRRAIEAFDPAALPERVAFLCSEAGPEKCHRRLVAEMLAERWSSRGHPIEVKHLVSLAPKRPTGAKAKSGRRRSKRSSDRTGPD